MLGKDGLIGLEMLARFLRKRNGNSGTVFDVAVLVGRYHGFP